MTPPTRDNAENYQQVNLSQHAVILGMDPPATILPSTKRRHGAWSDYSYQKSITVFWSRVVPNDNGCWIWTGSRDNRNYGRWSSPYWHGGIAHRVAWEMLRGVPPARATGLELDHRCHTEDETCFGGDECPHRPCVNPDHLRVVTRSQNATDSRYRLTTHCRQGHAMSGPNLYVNPRTGQRTCRQCVRDATQRWLAKGDNRERQNALRNARRAS